MMLIKGELEFIKTLIRYRKDINTEKLQEVKEQLICGDKYEMIYMDLIKIVNGSNVDLVIPDEYRGYQGGVLKYLLKITKEEYFPLQTKPTPCEVELSFAKGFEQGVRKGIEFAKGFESERKRG